MEQCGAEANDSLDTQIAFHVEQKKQPQGKLAVAFVVFVEFIAAF